MPSAFGYGADEGDRTMWLCLDCGVDTQEIDEYYMVDWPVWEEATGGIYGGPPNGMLCIGCLETRLGRELTPDDFLPAPINQGFFPQSARLKKRLGLL